MKLGVALLGCGLGGVLSVWNRESAENWCVCVGTRGLVAESRIRCQKPKGKSEVCLVVVPTPPYLVHTAVKFICANSSRRLMQLCASLCPSIMVETQKSLSPSPSSTQDHLNSNYMRVLSKTTHCPKLCTKCVCSIQRKKQSPLQLGPFLIKGYTFKAIYFSRTF